MGASTDTAAKARLFANWDFGDTVRVAMVAGMVWLTIEAPATTTLAPPYSHIMLAAYYAAIASALFTPQFWARFGRMRADGATTLLPGDRLFQIVTLLALIAATPMTILWAIETPASEPWSLGFYWLCIALFVGAGAVCLRNLLRSNDLIHLDAEGIAAPRLWHGTIPWSAIKSAKSIGSRSDNALLIQFEAPREMALIKRRLDWSLRLGTEKRSVAIPGLLLGMQADRIAALLEERVTRSAR